MSPDNNNNLLGQRGAGVGTCGAKLSSRTEPRQLIPQLLSTCPSDWLPNHSALLDGDKRANSAARGREEKKKKLKNDFVTEGGVGTISSRLFPFRLVKATT